MYQHLTFTTSALEYHYRDDDIHEFIFHSVADETIDLWVSTIHKIKPIAVESSAHIRSIYNIQGLWPTPYATRQAIAVNRLLPKHIRNSTALLMDDNSMGLTVAQMILRYMPSHTTQSRRIFFHTDEALRWLEDRRMILSTARTK